jgi:hypothetical protein
MKKLSIGESKSIVSAHVVEEPKFEPKPSNPVYWYLHRIGDHVLMDVQVWLWQEK